MTPGVKDLGVVSIGDRQCYPKSHHMRFGQRSYGERCPGPVDVAGKRIFFTSIDTIRLQ